MISSVSYFNLGIETLFGRLSLEKPPHGDGTEFLPPVTAWSSQLGGMEGG